MSAFDRVKEQLSIQKELEGRIKASLQLELDSIRPRYEALNDIGLHTGEPAHLEIYAQDALNCGNLHGAGHAIAQMIFITEPETRVIELQFRAAWKAFLPSLGSNLPHPEEL